MGRKTSNITCPTCHGVKVRLAARKGLSDVLLGGFTIYPFRCQLCAERFRKFLGRRTLNPRRSFDRVEVSFPVWFRIPRTPGSPRVGQEGVIENLSIRGCRIRTTAPVIIGSRLELEFQYSNDSLPITIAEAVVRSSVGNGTIGLRFTRLHRGEERRIRRIIDVWLPELMPSRM
ncbi:MAG: PilZ domain-containing protein [Nitrospira sp.]|nr:PilZ domain-containing protein [Nitrospira sp.]MDH4242916.1 PilZ domain-containing protein [Nitrospira sp.]MDH4356252.1 PilZ domain-containing protein [Nitrospira sp.]MDH5318142.1 PilZ domain-containing protein [Nitrospira sp.]